MPSRRQSRHCRQSFLDRGRWRSPARRGTIPANAIANLQSAIGTVDTNGDGIGDSGPFSNVVGNLVSDVGTKVPDLPD